MYDEPKLIHAGRAIDDRGVLTFCNEFNLQGVVRFYSIRNHRRGLVRAWHGHEHSDTFLWPISGMWTVAAVRSRNMKAMVAMENVVTEPVGPQPQKHAIDGSHIYHVPAGWYHGHQSLTDGAILGVFSTATIGQVRTDDLRLPWDRWPEVWEEVQR